MIPQMNRGKLGIVFGTRDGDDAHRVEEPSECGLLVDSVVHHESNRAAKRATDDHRVGKADVIADDDRRTLLRDILDADRPHTVNDADDDPGQKAHHETKTV